MKDIIGMILRMIGKRVLNLLKILILITTEYCLKDIVGMIPLMIGEEKLKWF